MSRAAQIAIVDDDEGMRQALEGLVLSIGYTPCCFAAPAEFLAAPDRSEIACIILDVKMPGMSGLELKRILNSQARPTPVIFLSSYADEAMHRQAVATGAKCVLAKPVDDTALIACIEAALGRGDGK